MILAPRSPTPPKLLSAAPPPCANRAAKSAGTPAAWIWRGISSSRTDPKIEPVSASPTVPPTCWKSVRLLVAVPSSRGGTEFCTTNVKIAKDGPTPTPVIAIHSQTSGVGVSGRRLVRRKRPSADTTSELAMMAL